MKLKDRHLITVKVSGNEMFNPTVPAQSTAEAQLEHIYEDYEAEEYETEDFDIIENAEESDECDEFYLRYYADFLNRLVNVKFIPVSTVQQIAEEYLSNTKKSLERREKLLRKSLSSVEGMNQTDIDKVVKEVIEMTVF